MKWLLMADPRGATKSTICHFTSFRFKTSRETGKVAALDEVAKAVNLRMLKKLKDKNAILRSSFDFRKVHPSIDPSKYKEKKGIE